MQKGQWTGQGAHQWLKGRGAHQLSEGQEAHQLSGGQEQEPQQLPLMRLHPRWSLPCLLMALQLVPLLLLALRWGQTSCSGPAPQVMVACDQRCKGQPGRQSCQMLSLQPVSWALATL